MNTTNPEIVQNDDEQLLASSFSLIAEALYQLLMDADTSSKNT